MVDLRNVSTQFLSESQRRGIHKVRSSNLHDVNKFFGLRIEGISQNFQSRNRNVVHHFIAGDVHCGWKGVVARLRFVDIIVRVNHFVSIIELSTIENMSSVGNHLVDVHV